MRREQGHRTQQEIGERHTQGRHLTKQGPNADSASTRTLPHKMFAIIWLDWKGWLSTDLSALLVKNRLCPKDIVWGALANRTVWNEIGLYPSDRCFTWNLLAAHQRGLSKMVKQSGQLRLTQNSTQRHYKMEWLTLLFFNFFFFFFGLVWGTLPKADGVQEWIGDGTSISVCIRVHECVHWASEGPDGRVSLPRHARCSWPPWTLRFRKDGQSERLPAKCEACRERRPHGLACSLARIDRWRGTVPTSGCELRINCETFYSWYFGDYFL